MMLPVVFTAHVICGAFALTHLLRDCCVDIHGPIDAAAVFAVFVSMGAAGHRQLVSSRDPTLPMLLGLAPLRGTPQRSHESGSNDTGEASDV